MTKCAKCLDLKTQLERKKDEMDKLYKKYTVVPSNVRMRYERLLLWDVGLLSDKEKEQRKKMMSDKKKCKCKNPSEREKRMMEDAIIKKIQRES